jgi:cell division cycle protein 37
MNGHLLEMLDKLIGSLDGHFSQAPEEVVMQALVQLSSEDHSGAPEIPQGAPGYAQMIASLVDMIKKDIDDEKPTDRWKAFLDKLKVHREKLVQQTKGTEKKLADLEKEDDAKITSDNVHEGFSSGHINKESSKPAPPKKTTSKVQTVEQLNAPSALNSSSAPIPTDQPVSSDVEADAGDAADDEDGDEHIEPTALGREFGKIQIGQYRECLLFISGHPDVVAEKETDGLLIDAFNSQMAGKDTYAKQFVHQALLLQYCRQLGRDGVSLFFKR